MWFVAPPLVAYKLIGTFSYHGEIIKTRNGLFKDLKGSETDLFGDRNLHFVNASKIAYQSTQHKCDSNQMYNLVADVR